MGNRLARIGRMERIKTRIEPPSADGADGADQNQCGGSDATLPTVFKKKSFLVLIRPHPPNPR